MIVNLGMNTVPTLTSNSPDQLASTLIDHPHDCKHADDLDTNSDEGWEEEERRRDS